MRPTRIKGNSMHELREALEWMYKLCNTHVTIDDIEDALLSSLEEKQELIRDYENAKAAIGLQRVKDLIIRMDNLK